MQGLLQVGEFRIDPVAREVTLGGRPITLSAKEFALLRTLAAEPTRVFTKVRKRPNFALVALDGIARSDGFDFAILCGDCAVRRVLKETGLDRVLPLVDPSGADPRAESPV